jgi:hypothetical protein
MSISRRQSKRNLKDHNASLQKHNISAYSPYDIKNGEKVKSLKVMKKLSKKKQADGINRGLVFQSSKKHLRNEKSLFEDKSVLSTKSKKKKSE